MILASLALAALAPVASAGAEERGSCTPWSTGMGGMMGVHDGRVKIWDCLGAWYVKDWSTPGSRTVVLVELPLLNVIVYVAVAAAPSNSSEGGASVGGAELAVDGHAPLLRQADLVAAASGSLASIAPTCVAPGGLVLLVATPGTGAVAGTPLLPPACLAS